MTTDASSGPSSLTIPMPFMGIYDVSLPAHTGAAAGTYDASFVHAKVDPVRVQQLLDDKSSRRYVFRLPKPEEYVPAGRDESRVADAYPPPSSTQGSHATATTSAA